MEKQPIKSIRVSAGMRIYYFDAHNDKNGEPYLAITEVPLNHNPGQKKRQRVFIHTEDIEKFATAFTEVANYIKSDGKTN